MKILAILAILILTIAASAQNPQDVVINEIMYAPTASSSQEWFEIYNKSTTSFNLNNWKWRDGTGVVRTITTRNVNIDPNSFTIVCEDSNAIKGFYSGIGGIILQSSAWNALNNTGDQVVIMNSSSLVIDSVSYLPVWGGSTNNRSLERRLATGPSNQQPNWGTSLDPSGATPNRTNSLTPKQNDLIVNYISFNPASPIVGDSLHITANIKNLGILPANNYSVNFYEDFNRDSIPVAGELFYTYNSVQPLVNNDSISITTVRRLDSLGLRIFIVKVSFAPDEDTLNNKKIAGIDVSNSSSSGSVIINEIMYDNPPGECEWVELYNNSDSSVNLRNWTIKDSSGTPITITNTDYTLNGRNYVVISKNNAIFTAHPSLPPGATRCGRCQEWFHPAPDGVTNACAPSAIGCGRWSANRPSRSPVVPAPASSTLG